MTVCKVCKQENEEEFEFCKNCGAELPVAEKYSRKEHFSAFGKNYAVNSEMKHTSYSEFGGQAVPESYDSAVETASETENNSIPTVKDTPETFGLVPVLMNLPSVDDPKVRKLQNVYVTKEQYEAMKKAGMIN